jgi:hypothetical protein
VPAARERYERLLDAWSGADADAAMLKDARQEYVRIR